MDFPTTFKDRLDRTWRVDFTWSAAQRLKSATGISLDDLIALPTDKSSATPLVDLLSDPFKVFECVVAVLGPQLRDAGVTVDEFGDGFDAGTIATATQAFLQGLHDFFRSHPAKQALMRRVVAMSKQALQATADRIEVEMAKQDVTANVNREIDRRLSESFTNTLASSESTPVCGHCGDSHTQRKPDCVANGVE